MSKKDIVSILWPLATPTCEVLKKVQNDLQGPYRSQHTKENSQLSIWGFKLAKLGEFKACLWSVKMRFRIFSFPPRLIWNRAIHLQVLVLVVSMLKGLTSVPKSRGQWEGKKCRKLRWQFPKGQWNCEASWFCSGLEMVFSTSIPSLVLCGNEIWVFFGACTLFWLCAACAEVLRLNTLARDSLNEHGFAEEATLPDAELLRKDVLGGEFLFGLFGLLGGIWINDDHLLWNFDTAGSLASMGFCRCGVWPLCCLINHSCLPNVNASSLSSRAIRTWMETCWVPYTMDSL